MRYWSYEKNGVVDNGILVHTKEEIKAYEALRASGDSPISSEHMDRFHAQQRWHEHESLIKVVGLEW